MNTPRPIVSYAEMLPPHAKNMAQPLDRMKQQCESQSSLPCLWFLCLLLLLDRVQPLLTLCLDSLFHIGFGLSNDGQA